MLTALFVLAERHAKQPLIPLHLFRSSIFNIAGLIGLAVGIAMFGAVSYIPFFLQTVDHVSATVSGLLMLPLVGGLLVSSIGSGAIVTATGRYKVFPILGTAVAAGGLGLLSRMDATSTRLENGIYMAVLGLGIGLMMQILVLVVQNAAAREDLGSATAASNYIRQIGGTVGSGIVGALFASRLTSKISHLLPPGSGAHVPNVQSLTPKEISGFPPAVEHALVTAYSYALPPIFLWLVPVLGAAFVLSFFLKEIRLRTTVGSDAAPADAAVQPDGPAGEPVAADPAAMPGERTLAGAGGGAGGPLAGLNGQERSRAELVPAYQAAPVAVANAAVPGPAVHGHVSQPGGTPLAGATVTLIDPAGRQAGRGSTGPDGSYRISASGQGTYTLVAMASSHRPHASAVHVGGQPVEVDVLLAGASRLTGTVRAAGTGSPLAGVTVTLADLRGEVVAGGNTGEAGGYLIEDLAAGRYTLALSAPSCQPTALQVVVADGEETTQDAELRAGARVEGAARTAAGTSVPDARVTLLDPDGNVAAVATTGPDGRYSFENLAQGDYTVIASGYPPAASRLRISSGQPHSHDVQLGHPEA